MLGMIVDSTIQHARDLDLELQRSKKRKKVQVLSELKDVIFCVDASGNDSIDMSELEGFPDTMNKSCFNQIVWAFLEKLSALPAMWDSRA